MKTHQTHVVAVSIFQNAVDVVSGPLCRIFLVQSGDQAVDHAGGHKLKAENALRKSPTEDANRSNEIIVRQGSLQLFRRSVSFSDVFFFSLG